MAILLLAAAAVAAEPSEKKEAAGDKEKAAQAAKKADAKKEKADEGKQEKSDEKAKSGDGKKPDKKKKPDDQEKPDAEAKAKAAEDEADKPDKPETHTVKRERIRIEVSVDGIIEGEKMAPVAVDPEEWKTLKPLEAKDHGAKVSKGDVLIRFETEDLDKAIEDLKTSQRLAEMGLKEAQQRLEALEATTPLDVAAAERAKRHASEDMERYFAVQRPLSKKSADQSLKSYRNMLEYEQEELRQLEKMYKSDDLTEETEEIILKRQRDAVQRAKFYLEQAEVGHEETLKINLPRRDKSIRDMTKRQDITSNTVTATLPLTVGQQRLEAEKRKIEHDRNAKRLKELLADREKMTVRSPIDGIVYYGKYVRGDWSGGTSVADAMRSGGKVSPDDTLMTVVRPDPLASRVTVPEKDLHWFRRGLQGLVEPTGYPDVLIDGTVETVERVPLSQGKFFARLRLKNQDENQVLVPGMACSAKFVPYFKRAALVVPAKAVFTDDRDLRRKYVYLVIGDRPARKQRVEVGHKSDDKLEILDGLNEGDQVLLERPKDEK